MYLRNADFWISGAAAAVRRETTAPISETGFCISGAGEKKPIWS
jgi:hypothetical protein